MNQIARCRGKALGNWDKVQGEAGEAIAHVEFPSRTARGRRNVFGVVHGDVASTKLTRSAAGGEGCVWLALTPASSDEAPLEARWRAGEEGRLGDRRYLLLGDKAGLIREEGDPRGQVRRQALARQTDPTPKARQAYAWLRQGDRDLTRERDLLARAHAAGTGNPTAPHGGRRHDGRPLAGFPRIAHHEAGAARSRSLFPGPPGDNLPAETVRVRFPPGSLDAWQVTLLRAGIRGLVTVMERLHRLGASHRNLSPESIIRCWQRAVHAPRPRTRRGRLPAREGRSYQAPEQAFGSRLPGPGPATDVYQLARHLHLVTGANPAETPRPAAPGAA